MRTGVALLLLAISVPSALAADPPKAKLAELVKLYQACDLPLPPKNAKLYRFTDEQGEKPGRRVWLQLVFRPEAEDGPNMTLRGLDTHRLSASNSKYYQEVSPPDAKAMAGVTDDTEDLLFLAIQCDLLGWHELGVAGFDTWQARQLKNTNPVGDLRHRAWWYWADQIQKPDSDWVKIARRLQGMHNDKPNATDADTPDILRRLKLSLVPSKAKPGSVDALIDELIDVSVVQNFYTFAEPDPRVDAIVKLGFDAIPALIAHLDDDRLTRTRYAEHIGGTGLPNLNSFPSPYMYSVRHFARDLLCEYMSDKGLDGMRSFNKVPEKTKALKWWADAKEEGEEKYLLRKVVPDEFTSIWPNTQLIRVIEVKYPQRLPDVFSAVLKTKYYHTSLAPFVTAICRSPLPAVTKKRMLLDTFDCDAWEWRAEALIGLYPLDADEFHKWLIASLSALPASNEKEDLLFDGHVAFARAAYLTDDEKTWEAVGKYMRRVDADVRRRWIDSLTGRDDEKSRSRLRRIACVAAFLDDESIRNFAAEHLGRMLNVPIEPYWSADDWAKFRDEVRAAAIKEVKAKPTPKAKPADKK